MLCFPGFTPVANDAHAVGDSGDCVVPSGYRPPWAARRARLGSCPSLIHLPTRPGSMPSNPRITSFCVYLAGDARLAQDAAAMATPHATRIAVRRWARLCMDAAIITIRMAPAAARAGVR